MRICHNIITWGISQFLIPISHLYLVNLIMHCSLYTRISADCQPLHIAGSDGNHLMFHVFAIYSTKYVLISSARLSQKPAIALMVLV